MLSVLGELLPLAIGVAISPIPIVAVVLMLMSARASATGGGFALGWVAGIALVTAVVTLLAGRIGPGDDGEPSAAVSWIKIVLGVLLVVLAAGQWRARSDHSTPGWMKAIDEFTAGRAAGLGVLLAAVNPKNLLLCVSAGLLIGTGELPDGSVVTTVVVFVLLASATVVVPVLGYRAAADRLRDPLHSLEGWLSANNHVVMAIVLLLMGAAVFGKGLGAL